MLHNALPRPRLTRASVPNSLAHTLRKLGTAPGGDGLVQQATSDGRSVHHIPERSLLKGGSMLRVVRLGTAIGAAAVLTAGVLAPARAQTTASASINAIAFVVGVAPITATGVNDLDFGTVTAGAPATPASLASDAGRFSITGEPLAPVTVSFTLPTVLVGGGGATIPISFSATDGLLWNPYPASFTTFDPNGPFVTAIDAAGNLVIGISGTVFPPVGATTGSYTGTITLTVSYL